MESQALNSAVSEAGLTVFVTCSLALLSIAVIDGGYELRRWWKARRKNAAGKAEPGNHKSGTGNRTNGTEATNE